MSHGLRVRNSSMVSEIIPNFEMFMTWIRQINMERLNLRHGENTVVSHEWKDDVDTSF